MSTEDGELATLSSTETEGTMAGTPMIYCVQCRALRPVSDWREQRDTLIIQFELCGHLIVRKACLEWA